MKRFDYSFIKDSSFPARLLNTAGGIYSLKTMAEIRKTDFPNAFPELERIAVVQSVKSSNAIEGIVTSDARIQAIFNKNSSPVNHDEQEIAGYRDALGLIHDRYKEIEFNERNILELHRILLSHTDDPLSGKYKERNNQIIEIDPQGNRSVRFSPVPADETRSAMQQLCLAYEDASSDSGLNQLILIPCVILDFLCIHPFRDGNGRLSRLLTLLLLYREGFDVVKYISFEEQINNYKQFYYDALKRSSADWHENANDYNPFIENFLSMLYMCYKELDKRFNVVNSGKVNKSSRVESIVLGSLTPISKAEIHNILPDVSITTIENVLAGMLRKGQIKKTGSTRGARYIRNWE